MFKCLKLLSDKFPAQVPKMPRALKKSQNIPHVTFLALARELLRNLNSSRGFLRNLISARGFLLSLGLGFLISQSHAQTVYPKMGRAATSAEIAAWNIDVRPDFAGLPKGSGSVAKGEQVWEAKCASCHGSFGEAYDVFTPIVGGTNKDDVKRGTVASLKSGEHPTRTTMMKVAHVSTLWDYINRAMPWTAPKSLSTEEVYALTAYVLSLAEVVPDDFVLSDKNIIEVQKRLPNRNGLTQQHGLWRVAGTPDVKAVACMNNCKPAVKIESSLPDYAKNSHGNLAEQNRNLGGVRGMNTAAGQAATVAATPTKPDVLKLANANACMACHAVANRVVGPSFNEVANKYKNQADALALLSKKIAEGGVGAWGQIPMPAQAQLKAEESKLLAQWILEFAK